MPHVHARGASKHERVEGIQRRGCLRDLGRTHVQLALTGEQEQAIVAVATSVSVLALVDHEAVLEDLQEVSRLGVLHHAMLQDTKQVPQCQ